MEEESPLLSLPTDPLLHIFSFVDFRDLIKRFRALTHHDSLWKSHCEKYWLIKKCDPDTNWHSTFVEYYKNYGRYIHCYSQIRKAWTQLEDYTEKHFPKIYKSLKNGLSEEEIDSLRTPRNTKLPDDVRCSYRIHDGQTMEEFRFTPGLFGAMEIHGHIKIEVMLDLKSALDSVKEEPNSSMSTCMPLTTSEMSSLYIALTSDDGHKEGQVMYTAVDQEKCAYANLVPNVFDDFVIASSFTEWFTDYAQMLADGRFPKIYDQIYRFPDDPKCVAKTGSITVKAATCFMPEFSTVHPPRMSMDPQALKSESCQLETRHWIITDEHGNVETVNGPGVVGEYPVMKPGAEYSWISCTSFNTQYGNMRGHFSMRNLSTGTTLDVRCPTYHMRSPTVQTSTERHERKLEAQPAANCDYL